MKSVLITGVSGGLGSALAREYIKRGYFVFGCDLFASEKLSNLTNDDLKIQFQFVELNAGSDESTMKAFEEISQQTNAIDIIVNAAGILPANSANVLEDFDITASLEVFNINTLGPLRVTKAFLKLLKNGEDKMLVNISSEAGSMTTHSNYIIRYDYCMSKAGVNMQSIILQRYLKEDGIKVLAVHPGWMKTQMGGEEAPILPETSAKGIADLSEKYRHQLDSGIYFDYDGSSRAW